MGKSDKLPRILAVDDEQDLLILYRRILEKLDVEVDIASNGEEGLIKARKEPFPALIVTDIKMPVMGGLEFCQTLRKETTGLARTPIIIMSAFGDEATILKGYDAGASDYLVKPLRPGELLAKIRHWLRQAPSEEDLRVPDEGTWQAPIIPPKLGPWNLTSKLGQGGVGTVYRARNQTAPNDEEVALKVLSPWLMEDASTKARFLREIELSQDLDHPNLVKVLGMGQEERIHFYLMELVPYDLLHSLSLAGKSSGNLDLRRVTRQIATALNYLKNQDLIHRDVKTSNIFYNLQSGEVKLGDFGLVRPTSGMTLTALDVVPGTIEYMAPELFKGHPGSVASDLYALGVVLYKMAVGHTPFKGGKLEEVMKGHLFDEVPDPKSLRRSEEPLDSEIFDIMMTLLSKAPEDRPSVATLMSLTD